MKRLAVVAALVVTARAAGWILDAIGAASVAACPPPRLPIHDWQLDP